MIDLYYWTTPNGHKITIFLEEAGLAYTIKPVNIGKGEQFDPEFLEIAPNNRIPAIVDHAPADGGAPLSVFESGAILMYLGREDRPLPADGLPRPRRVRCSGCSGRWAGSGRWPGRTTTSTSYAPEKIPYAIDRYVKETSRLYGGAEPAARRPRVHRRRLLDRRHGVLSVGPASGSRTWRVSRTSRAGRGDRRAACGVARLLLAKTIETQPLPTPRRGSCCSGRTGTVAETLLPAVADGASRRAFIRRPASAMLTG